MELPRLSANIQCRLYCNIFLSVTCKTVFHGTKIALQKWVLAISLIANAKKSLSSHQLARDLDLNQKTGWYMMTRIRAEIAKKGGHYYKGSLRQMKPISVASLASQTSAKMRTRKTRMWHGERRYHRCCPKGWKSCRTTCTEPNWTHDP